TGHRMPPPPCYLDECVDQGAAQILRERGNAATTVHDHGMRGAADDEQLEFAVQRGWVLVSHNERHFLRRHRTYGAQGRSHAGILIVPETPSPRGRIRLCPACATYRDAAGLAGDNALPSGSLRPVG